MEDSGTTEKTQDNPQTNKSSEKGRYVVGAKQNPDGTWDYSNAMIMLSDKESKDAVLAAKQREEVINGRVKHLIEANPESYVDVVQARKYWGERYDNSLKGQKMELQMNELYAQKYENYAVSAGERILDLEEKLNDAGTDDEKQQLLLEIVEERNWINECKDEAHQRRGY